MDIQYIYFTRIIVFLMQSTLPYRASWMAPLAKELAALAFYAATGRAFRPREDNPYLRVRGDDDMTDAEIAQACAEAAAEREQQELEMSEFGLVEPSTAIDVKGGRGE